MLKLLLDFFQGKLKENKTDKNFRASISIYVYGSIGTMIAAAVYFFAGIRLLSAFIALAGLIFIAGVFIFLHGYKKTTIVLDLIGVSIVTLAGDIFLGINSGAHYFLLASIILYISADKENPVFRYITSFVCFMEFVAVCVFLNGAQPVVALPSTIVMAIDKINLLIAFGAIGFTMHNYSNAAEEKETIHREYNLKLLHMANSDQLTGLPNRRSTYQELDLLAKKYQSASTGFVVGLADIDNFKHINDTYGHLCGDEVLIEAGVVMKNYLRKMDFVGRWGGEEFLIILPDTNLDDGIEIMNRLKKSFEDTLFSCGSQQINITITIGVSAFSNISSITELLQRADDHLYKGKSIGKNCIVEF